MAFRAGHLLTLAWRAKKKKPMIMLSSESSAATEGATEDQIKPVVVHTYNKHMNGVDIADQYSTYYCFLRKTVEWWRKLCFWLLETAVVNSFVLYKDITKPARQNHLAYRRSIVESLASRYLASAPESWQAPLPKTFFHRNLCFSTYLQSLSLTGFQTLLGLSIWIQRECIYQLIYQPTS